MTTPADPIQLAQAVRLGSQQLANTPISFRHEILLEIADLLVKEQEQILSENAKDIEYSSRAENNVTQQLLSRLKLSPQKIDDLVGGLKQLTTLEDPLNRSLKKTLVADGLTLEQKSTPIGVILIIFESRPDALIQIASLTLCSGNGVILKGGKEATHSNRCLAAIIEKAIANVVQRHAEDPSLSNTALLDVVKLVETRSDISTLLQLNKYIDLVIPRGSNQLVTYCQNNTKIPVLGHADGICHVYVDKDNTNIEKLNKIIIDSKCNYPSACNAMEMLVLDKALFAKKLDNSTTTTTPLNLEEFKQTYGFNILNNMINHNIQLYFTQQLVELLSSILSTELDLAAVFPGYNLSFELHHEFGDLACNVHVVDGITEAISFINGNSSSHTESILTENKENMVTFTKYIDSASVFANCSTRFADGHRYGLGAEIGVSTSRIHARGPVGLEGLTTQKWIMISEETETSLQSKKEEGKILIPGHIVGEFSSKDRVYIHKKL